MTNKPQINIYLFRRDKSIQLSVSKDLKQIENLIATIIIYMPVVNLYTRSSSVIMQTNCGYFMGDKFIGAWLLLLGFGASVSVKRF